MKIKLFKVLFFSVVILLIIYVMLIFVFGRFDSKCDKSYRTNLANKYNYYIANPSIKNCEKIDVFNDSCGNSTGVGMKSECYLELFKKNHDSVICDKILSFENKKMKDFNLPSYLKCYKLIGLDGPEACEKLVTSIYYLKCLDFFKQPLTIDKCNTLSKRSGRYQSDCYDNLAYRLAYQTGNVNYCFMNGIRLDCVNELSLKKNDLTLCNNCTNEKCIEYCKNYNSYKENNYLIIQESENLLQKLRNSAKHLYDKDQGYENLCDTQGHLKIETGAPMVKDSIQCYADKNNFCLVRPTYTYRFLTRCIDNKSEDINYLYSTQCSKDNIACQ